YGQKNFRNKIIFKRRQDTHNFANKHLGKIHDTILWYAHSRKSDYRIQYLPYEEEYLRKMYSKSDKKGRYRLLPCTNEAGGNRPYEFRGLTRAWRYTKQNMQSMYDQGLLYQATPTSPFQNKKYLADAKGVPIQNLWGDIPAARGIEHLGYPTQKPLALMERIIRASSNEGDTVLDPFCGCGTTVHAAEALGRKWLGIDISKFSTGLIRDRILHNFKYLNADDLDMRGTPDSVREARELARQDPFEFEKWVCGYIGAEGMFREPGERGADGGVDGVLKFFPIREGKKIKPEYAIVQVKGGRVSADNVKALHETVRRYEATAGVMVCFADQLGTVENQRVKATFKDAWGSYPVIQGFSVESLLSDGQLDLPLYGYKRRGAMLGL
ncbi:MAG: site-specific DNA-methyltransferase, partial [Chloroflexi bacterium]|nr:site-specific DNA-methyltransferase [Chloroflexota bacterium]